MYKKILIPVDGSELSRHAAQEGIRLAGLLGSEVLFLYVVDIAILTIPDAEAGLANTELIREGLRTQGNRLLEELGGAAVKAKVSYKGMLAEGDVHEEIIRVAHEAGAELIVMGTHGRRGLNRLLLGSVAESVTRRAHCAVLLIRPSSV
jgi:nucleotide-binding universal stress UspA family protein